ncbi:hypothetical protein FRC06_007682 [Ceratobasidium sp. 370]|nr:hypothetical protein FRC06_007682 [Ceratobasidium sp. 370]
MQHCIKEWSTGRFVAQALDGAKHLKMYKSHLKGLLEYVKPTSKWLLEFRRTWFWYTVDYAGATLEDEPYQAITWADQVCPDTPDGETCNCSTKGKGCAMH